MVSVFSFSDQFFQLRHRVQYNFGLTNRNNRFVGECTRLAQDQETQGWGWGERGVCEKKRRGVVFDLVFDLFFVFFVGQFWFRWSICIFYSIAMHIQIQMCMYICQMYFRISMSMWTSVLYAIFKSFSFFVYFFNVFFFIFLFWWDNQLRENICMSFDTFKCYGKKKSFVLHF